ncbi:hypothetical protein GCM10022223_55380 [Kineosporia mesophila]|uniref:Ricin B lectin domain-containing protein n=1 Tax=Kineosporia mesophila TaxID=566012 RepID=A0ABP7AE60_9ACTN|nr:hypothetical protein [Kineosporia mesophila]MCD5352841.1 hypothetical protein [Kineosporia mesophila]
MFSARISHRAKTVTAIAAVPGVAAGLWLATAGTAQAAEKSDGSTISVAATKKPITGEAVLIKASKLKGKNRIVTVRSTGAADLYRSKPTASNGLSTDGTSMLLKKVGSKYQIMSLNDSEEINSYCLQQKFSGKLSIAVCNKKKTNQLFSFEKNGKKFAIAGKWGYLKADKRKLRIADIDTESMSFFSVTARS